jgi:glycosyltransferase involved in cell wall biosynthesis
MSEKKPTVSVIIPTYNRADCITKSIDSVLSQNYNDYEIIVVDDGSTDNTRQILQVYVDKGLIRYIYQDNAGCAAARNVGISTAKGEWIAFLDSDDRWLPDKLAVQMQYLLETGLDVCFTNIAFEYNQDSKIDISNPKQGQPDRWIATDSLDLVITPNEFYTPLPSMVVKSSLLKKTGTFNEKEVWGSDTSFILKFCAERPVAYINRNLVIADRTKGRLRLTSGREMSSETGRSYLLAKVLTYAELYFRCRKQSKKTIKRTGRTLGFYLSILAVSCCITGDNYNARRFAKDGMHFAMRVRDYIRCICVLLCPWLVRRLRKNSRY